MTHTIIPLCVIGPSGTRIYACLDCGRPIWLGIHGEGWKHHVRWWMGRRKK